LAGRLTRTCCRHHRIAAGVGIAALAGDALAKHVIELAVGHNLDLHIGIVVVILGDHLLEQGVDLGRSHADDVDVADEIEGDLSIGPHPLPLAIKLGNLGGLDDDLIRRIDAIFTRGDLVLCRSLEQAVLAFRVGSAVFCRFATDD
jgi:hypothetical protein